MRHTTLHAQVPAATWQQAWVVDCRAVGSGHTALRYLAPYIFRVALSNNRIVALANDAVTFRYQDGNTRQRKTCTLPAAEFMQRFLQHVLPKGFVKVRYYGLFSPGKRRLLAYLRHLLVLTTGMAGPAARSQPPTTLPHLPVCPVCGQLMQVVPLLPRRSRGPPGSAPPRARV